MAFYQLPVRRDAVPYYRFTTELEGREFIFELRWNGRVERWFMTVLADAETPLAQGIKLLPRFPLLARFADPRLPPGSLFLFDTTNSDEPPLLGELGNRVQLLYASASETGAA